MEQKDEVGGRVYTASSPQAETTLYLNSSLTEPPRVLRTTPSGRRRRAVASGVQNTLSKTSMLAHFLPTGTLLRFEMVLPSIYGTGECTHVSTVMMMLLLGLCTLSCFFFHFTDSFRAPDGKVYYGFVTQGGLVIFKPGLDAEVPKDDKFKVHFADFVHAIMSVMVFLAIAFSDHRLTNGLLPPLHAKEVDEAMESFPLMVGIVCSCLFLIFPRARHGIGCMPT
ncbi:hypothetical protein Dimus_014910 [Dionaea muscipula]